MDFKQAISAHEGLLYQQRYQLVAAILSKFVFALYLLPKWLYAEEQLAQIVHFTMHVPH